MKAEQLSAVQRWSILGGVAILLSLAMGMRQSFGLFQPSLIREVGLTAADFSMAVALQNLIWGMSQPFAGMIADRYGSRWVMLAGVLIYGAGLLFIIFSTSVLLFTLGAGVCMGLAMSCTGGSIAMSVAARTVSPAKRSLAMGSVSAVGSLGLVIASPMAQTLISTSGWQVALIGFLGFILVMIPCALGGGIADRIEIDAADDTDQPIGEVMRTAFSHSGFLVMSGAYFVCGLQLIFLTTHLPNYIEVCGLDPTLSASALALVGLFNVLGSYLFGWLGGIYPKQILLGGAYILRSLIIAAYFYFPPTPLTTVIFASLMGMLWLGVVPLVNGLVAQLFGLRFMTTLVGVAFFSHQVGSFIGAWGGGVIFDMLGNYDVAWRIGVIIGLIAGVTQMLMNVRPPERRPMTRVPIQGTA